ncbi:MAG: MTAP family purine nucleoside phosphorylase [Thermaerobacter sp.]|nr:MTAP family purine nucleoside phosphorylase [Thermaerobacter sp.]
MLAIIGGTGVYQLPGADAEERELETPYGKLGVTVRHLPSGMDLIFAARHGTGHAVPPHRLPSRALIWGLREMGVTSILSTSAVGALTSDIPPGTLALLGDFMDFTKSRPTTFYDGPGVTHADVTEPYCPTLRVALRTAAGRLGIPLYDRDVVYVCTEGPRFETPSEIRAYRMLGGDVVGMTQVPEAVLARELGIHYAGVALVTNLAAGIDGSRPSHGEVLDLMARNGKIVSRLLLQAAEDIGENALCERCPKPEGMS